MEHSASLDSRHPALLICDRHGVLLHASAGARERFDSATRQLLVAAIGQLERSGDPCSELLVDGCDATLARLDGATPVYALAVTGEPSPCAELSPRQREVASHASTGASSREIAEALGISVHTVRQHLKDVYRTLGVGGRVELARLMMAA